MGRWRLEKVLKQKLYLFILISFIFFSPLVFLSVSSSLSPINVNLPLQTITNNNSQNPIFNFNQPIIQTTISSEIESATIQQKGIIAKTGTLANAWIESSTDYDGDGYYSRITIRWNADTDLDSEIVRVFVGFFLNKNYSRFYIFGTTGIRYTIYGSQPSIEEKEYMDIDWDGLTRGIADFSILLYDENSYVLYDTFNITDVKMESSFQDFPFMNPILFSFISFLNWENSRKFSLDMWTAMWIIALTMEIIGLGLLVYFGLYKKYPRSP